MNKCEYIYIYRLKAGGSPELPGTLSLEPILQTSLWYRDGGWGGVITSCGVRCIESCGNLEDVASLKMLLRCKYRCCLQKGGGGGVITSCGVRWIQSCGNLEDVASLTMLLRCKYRCCSRSKQLLQKAFVDVKMKKVWCSFRPWFSSELWHFLVINKTTQNAWNRNSNG